MIQKEPDRKYHAYCDACNCEPKNCEEGFDDYYEAVEAVRYAEWFTKKVDNVWVNTCPNCVYDR